MSDFWTAIERVRPHDVEWFARSGGTVLPGGTWAESLHPEPGISWGLSAAPSIAGRSISLSGWQSSSAEMSLQVAGVPAQQRVLANVVRGTPIEVYGRIVGGTWSRVGLGLSKAFGGAGSTMTLRCWDLLAALRSRPTTNRAEQQLFYGAGNQVVLDADYTPGDPLLEVTTTGIFDNESGQPGVVRVIPSSGDPPFYVTYMGKSSTQLTGIVGGAFGTTAASAVVGDIVQHVVLMVGAPVDIAWKVLTSTGTGSNGGLDTLPAEWGLGLPQSWLDDRSRRDLYRQPLAVSSGSQSWSVLVHDEVDDAMGWIRELLKPAGIWLTMSRGAIAARCAQLLHGAGTSTVHTGTVITAADIVRITDYQAWSSQVPTEYRLLQVQPAGGPAVSRPTTYVWGSAPTEIQKDLDLPHVWSNTTPITTNVAERLAPWWTRVPETMDIECGGWRLAHLTDGDVVDLDLSDLSTAGPATRMGVVGGYTRWPALVTAARPAWGGSSVRLSLAWYPAWAGAWP